MFKTASVGSFITNLPASYVKRFDPGNFQYKLSGDWNPAYDPNVPAEELNLGFAQEEGFWHEPISPSHWPLYRWDFRKDGTAIVSPVSYGTRQEVNLMPRAEITTEDKTYAFFNPLIINPVAAALAVYKGEFVPSDGQIPENAFDYEANERILRNLFSGGSECADNLNIQDIPGFKATFGAAAAMDTACRTPDRMSKELIESVIKWYGTNFQDTTCWIGAGTENVPIEQRVDSALSSGKITEDEYVRYRLEQIDLILSINRTPIMFPDQMQNEFGDDKNIEIMTRLLSSHPNEIVLHKLGSPFNAKTNYLNLAVLQAVAHLAYAVKTSDPRFPEQMKDYGALRAASERSRKNIAMHTGDDRGFSFVWEAGAREQLKSNRKPEVLKRNGMEFYAGKNISALLGYIGLNPRQTIKAIIELSRWYEEKTKKNECDDRKADRHLENYWKLMAPAMALSTDCFFGQFDRTPAYTGRVESANRFFGVLRPEDGGVLKHRGSYWKEKTDRQIMDGRLLALLVNAGAITVEELPTVIGRNKDMLYLAHVNPSSS